MRTGDAIDRQAAIDVADKFSDADGCNGSDVAMDIISGLISLPSAQPCYKTDHGYMWLCPECGLEVHSDYDRCVRCGWERRTDE